MFQPGDLLFFCKKNKTCHGVHMGQIGVVGKMANLISHPQFLLKHGWEMDFLMPSQMKI